MSIIAVSKYPLVVRFNNIETGAATPDIAYNKKPYTKIPRHRVFIKLSNEQLETLITIFESHIKGYDRNMDNRIRNSNGCYSYTFVIERRHVEKFNTKPAVKTFYATAFPKMFYNKKLGYGIAITLTYKPLKFVKNNEHSSKVFSAVVKEKNVIEKKSIKFVIKPTVKERVRFEMPVINVRRNPDRKGRNLRYIYYQEERIEPETPPSNLRRNPPRKARYSSVYTY